jgi:hypothetical protein
MVIVNQVLTRVPFLLVTRMPDGIIIQAPADSILGRVGPRRCTPEHHEMLHLWYKSYTLHIIVLRQCTIQCGRSDQICLYS